MGSLFTPGSAAAQLTGIPKVGVNLPRTLASDEDVARKGYEDEIAAKRKQIEGKQAEISAIEKPIDEQIVGGLEGKKKATGEYQDMLNKPKPEAPAPMGHIADYKPRQLDPDAVNFLSVMAAAMTMIGGRKSHGAGVDAVRAMTAVMKGAREGNDAQAKKELEAYKVNMDKAFKEHQEALNEYLRIMNQRNTDLQQKWHEVELYATSINDLQTLETIKTKDAKKFIDEKEKAVDKLEEQKLKLPTAYDKMQQTLQQNLLRHQEHIASMEERKLATEEKESEFKPVPGVLTKDGKVLMVNGKGETKVVDQDVVSTKGGKGGGGTGGMAGLAGSRIVNSANEMSEAVRTTANMPISTTSPIYGEDRFEGGLFKAPLSVLNQKMSEPTSQMMQTRLTGVARNLASLEAGGAATGMVGLTKSMDKGINIPAGANLSVVLDKFAEMRQIFDTSVEAALVNPNVSDSQKDLLKKARENVHKAIPFTHDDVDAMTRTEDTEMSFSDYMKDKKGISIDKPAAHASGATFDTMPDAAQYAGKTIHDDTTGLTYKSDGKNWIKQ